MFPFIGDKTSVFLFIAFKLHPLGPLGKFLKEIVNAIVLLKNNKGTIVESSKSNLLKYLTNGPSITPTGEVSSMDSTTIFNWLHKNSQDRFAIARALAIQVISSCSEPVGVKGGLRALALFSHSCMALLK